MLNGAAAQLQAAPGIDSDPPDGPPTNLSAYTWGGSSVGLQWASGDALASTECWGSATLGASPDGAREAVTGPGVTSVDMAVAGGSFSFWFVRHRRNGQFSSWVTVSDPGGGGV